MKIGSGLKNPQVFLEEGGGVQTLDSPAAPRVRLAKMFQISLLLIRPNSLDVGDSDIWIKMLPIRQELMIQPLIYPVKTWVSINPAAILQINHADLIPVSMMGTSSYETWCVFSAAVDNWTVCGVHGFYPHVFPHA